MAAEKSYANGLDKYNQIKPFTNVLFNIFFLILALIAVIPVIFVLAISLSSEHSLDIYGYQLIPKEFSLDGYKFLADQYQMILRSLLISVTVTVGGTLLGIWLNTSLGYVMSRTNYKLNKFLTWYVFIPMIFNGGLVASYFVTASALKMKDTIWVLMIPLAVSSFNVIICKSFFRTTIPDSIVESAKMDGASQWRIYFSIVLPISLPVIATIGLFLCFGYWNDWFQSLLYIDNEKLLSLQALLNRIMGDIEYFAKNAANLGISVAELSKNMPKEAARMAIAIVIVLPIACAYPFFQKYFISGLTIGAVKG